MQKPKAERKKERRKKEEDQIVIAHHQQEYKTIVQQKQMVKIPFQAMKKEALHFTCVITLLGI